jgi:hypothetical protein
LRPELQVDRGNRLVSEAGVDFRQQRRQVLWRDGDDDRLKGLAIDAGVGHAAHPVAEAQRRTVCREPAASRFRQQLAEDGVIRISKKSGLFVARR